MASPPAWKRVDELIRLILELYGSGLNQRHGDCRRAGPAGEAMLERLAGDELVGSLLILHGLHPDDFATRVHKALIRVRPYLGSHGGDVELLQADEATGVVRLRMAGSCETCPSSTLTVKLAVETAIKEVAPEVTSIEVDGSARDVPPHNGLDDHVAEVDRRLAMRRGSRRGRRRWPKSPARRFCCAGSAKVFMRIATPVRDAPHRSMAARSAAT